MTKVLTIPKRETLRLTAYQLIMSAKVMSDLSEAVVGQAEGKAGELAKLPHEKRIAAVEAAATIAHNKKMTAKDIRKVVEKASPETVKSKPTAQPDDLVRHAPIHRLDNPSQS